MFNLSHFLSGRQSINCIVDPVFSLLKRLSPE